MIALCGYDLYSSTNSLNPNPTCQNIIDAVKIQNAVFDYVYSTYNTGITIDSAPTWDFSTIMLAQFVNTLSAGNLSETLNSIEAVTVVRTDVDTGDRVVVYRKNIKSPTIDEFNFIFKDFACGYNKKYSYSVVPVLKTGATSSTIETDPVITKFKHVFLSDNTYTYKMIADIQYGNATQKINIGTFEPIGRKYPVCVSNALTNYQMGSLKSKVIANYFDLKEFNRYEITKQKDEILKFLTNKSPKILKDANGNMWLISITGAPVIEYDNNYGAGIMNVSFNFVEIGDATKSVDLTSCGVVPFLA